MSEIVRLVSIATAVPPHVVQQRDAATAAHACFADRFSEFSRLARVFESAEIKQRHTVRPLDWYFQPLGWPERHAAYIEGAGKLFEAVALKVLQAANLTGGDVDVVVTVSSTGIATPSLDARAAARLGFRADIERVPVFGLGCAGGVAGLSIAAKLAKAKPGCVVLLVVVETCSLAFRMDKLTKENIVATALFGDCAAACVLCTDTVGIASFEMSGQQTWADTLDIMGWSVDAEGLGVIFDRAIPPFAEAHVALAVTKILANAGLSLPDVDRFICHPGGAKVITALEKALALTKGTLDCEREVLAEYGNMSACTVLFVLDRAIKAGLPPRSILLAMGPGFSLSCASLVQGA